MEHITNNFFEYTRFVNRKMTMEYFNIKEDCGKYSIRISTGDFIYFDRVLTNHPHNHTFYEICLVIDGQGIFMHNNKKYKLHKGMLFLARPQVVHEISSFETRDLYLVFFRFDIREIDVPLTNKNEDILVSNFLNGHDVAIQNVEYLFHYLPLLSAYIKGRLINKIILLKSLIFEFLFLLSKNHNVNTEESNIKHKSISTAVSYIMQNIDRSIKIKEIAKNSFISERHLRYLFRKYYSKSITGFIQEEKVRVAKNKMKMGFKAAEAAEAVGIYNQSQFSKLFKKITGMTPKEYCIHISEYI